MTLTDRPRTAPGTRGYESLSTSLQGTSLRIEGVEKWYRQGKHGAPRKVLDKITCEIAAGETVAIIGVSGCGKTTLLKICGGLVTKDRGQIFVGDQLVEGVPDDISFVFQDPALLSWETVAKNLAVGLIPKKKLPKEEKARLVEEQLAMVGLSDFARAYPYQLSGGMQQRVGLARALIGSPRLLLLDEPLGALDALTRVRLQEDLATTLAAAKTTSVLVTHDVDEALFLANRVIVMSSNPGRVASIIDVPGAPPRDRAGFLSDPVIVELKAEIIGQIVESGSSVLEQQLRGG